MTDYHRIKEIFQEAVEREGADRAAFLDEACAGDHELRAEVASMLARRDEIAGFLEAPAFALMGGSPAPEEPESIEGRRIGPYRLLRELGRGGMGAVYLAMRDDDQYRKRVAIKLVKRGMDTDFIVERFRTERQILANLDHAYIARLLDGGVDDDGAPYFAMEYVEGERIDTYCESHGLAVPARLELFRKVCAAVHYAHQHLVIHRDIKPSNILITADGTPKLLDFGIAKLLDSERNDQTATMFRLMTRDYASPEQVAGGQVTTSSDVYSLGVLLYELLTGRRLHPGQLVPPSQMGGPTTRSLRGDLDTIVLMAMRREPERRYSSAAQLSEDIRRHVAGLPVIARKDTLAYRAGKFVRRHRAGVAAAIGVLVLLSGGVGGIVWQARTAAEERDRQRVEALKAERVTSFLEGMLTYRNQGPNVKVVDILDDASRQVETELNEEPEVKAELHETLGRTYNALRVFDRAQQHLEAAVALRRAVDGPGDVKVAETLSALAGVFLVKGDYATASTYEEQALAIARAAPGTDPLVRARIERDDGAAQRFLGRHQYALRLFQEALSAFQAAPGDQREMVATIYNDIAGLHRDEGDLAQAISNDERSVAIFTSMPRRAALEAHAEQELALSLADRGEYARAEALVHAALALRKQIFGDSHPDIANSLDVLGWIAFLEHDYPEAWSAETDALAMYRRFFPPGAESLGVAGPLDTLAKIEMVRGRPAQAEPYLRESLAIVQRLLPAGNARIGETQGQLGECLRQQGRYAEADPIVAASAATLAAALGSTAPEAIDAQHRLERLHALEGGRR